jgi:hypothetical protein
MKSDPSSAGFADNVNLQGDNIDIIKINTELEAKAEKTKYTLLYFHQNAVQSHDIKILDNAAQFKYLEMAVSQEEI